MMNSKKEGKKTKVLLKWYDSLLDKESSMIVEFDYDENMSNLERIGEAITMLGEGDDYAIDIQGEVLPNDPKEEVLNGYLTLESVDPSITRDDFNNVSIGGFEARSELMDMQFDWEYSESSVVDKTPEHNLRIETSLKHYDNYSFPGYSFSHLKAATEIVEVYNEIFLYDSKDDIEKDPLYFKVVNLTITNALGEEFSFNSEILEKYNKVQLLNK